MADCDVTPQDCFFERGTPDGELDPGYYYAQGGEVDYGGLGVQIGARFTF